LIQAVLLGGVFIGVLSALPVIGFGNCCCCLWIVTGGMLTAYLDQDPYRPITTGRGAVDGFLAGVVGAFVWLFVSLAIQTVTAPLQERMIAELLEGPLDLPPQVRIWLEETRGMEVGLLSHIASFMMYLIAGMVFSTLGGVLGALFFWRDKVPPALGGPPPTPIPPEL
jgi:hypothetical protein